MNKAIGEQSDRERCRLKVNRDAMNDLERLSGVVELSLKNGLVTEPVVAAEM